MYMKEETLTEEIKAELLQSLKTRFENNNHRHENVNWEDVEKKLLASPDKIRSLKEMESSGGEPDVVKTEDDSYIFMDCAAESPKGRRSLCYDQEALESRKKHKPESSVIATVEKMGVELLTEDDYRYLQTLDTFDKKTSSWIETPEDIRALGGALFCDYRYGTVFTYHNGAESYYAARGFRGKLNI
ncbi:DUF4256 domain-containing protein [Salinicoccus sp. YB14-2]|uniref:DUF4256 domain-containing protein n=1 Tax=Salinicoccus sp. YB14-2 TaxID=1572701 RepID=UPI00068D4708